MKYLLFGTGDYYERYKKWFFKEDIVALVDNSTEKQGKILDDILVLSPAEAVKKQFDKVIILSFYFLEMKEQLIALGVNEDRIYSFYDLFQLIPTDNCKREIKNYTANKNAGTNYKKVLLLSHDLSLGGPALALFHAGEILRKNGYNVNYGSMIDGPLRKDLINQGISVIVDENLQWESMVETEWIKKYDLIICNTINYYTFLRERIKNIPVIWWLHDSHFFYGAVNKKVLKSIDMVGVNVVSVGKVPREAMNTFRPDVQIGELLYGVNEF